jgi:hypothetical protein
MHAECKAHPNIESTGLLEDEAADQIAASSIAALHAVNDSSFEPATN